MNGRTKRRRTAVNYAKLAAGGFDEDEDNLEDEEGEKDKDRESDEEEEDENGKGLRGRNGVASKPEIVKRRRREPVRNVRSPDTSPDSIEEKRADEQTEKRATGRVKKKRLVTSDSDGDEEFGYDNDQSEDFLPRKVRGQMGMVEEDDYVLDEEDEDLAEAEREALEEVKRLKKGHSAGGKLQAESKGAAPLQRTAALSKPAVAPKPMPKVMLAPTLSRSLSGGRSLPSPSGSMMKGAQGRLLKKIGFKAPLVSASTAKQSDVLNQRSLPKSFCTSQEGKKAPVSGKCAKTSKERVAMQPWFSTPESGKWGRKSTAILDDAVLFSPSQRLPRSGSVGNSQNPAATEASASPRDTSQGEREGSRGSIDGQEAATNQVDDVSVSDQRAAEQLEELRNAAKGKEELGEDGELVEERDQITTEKVMRGEVEALIGKNIRIGVDQNGVLEQGEVPHGGPDLG